MPEAVTGERDAMQGSPPHWRRARTHEACEEACVRADYPDDVDNGDNVDNAENVEGRYTEGRDIEGRDIASKDTEDRYMEGRDIENAEHVERR
jgi:hypothetical protein